MIYNPTIVDRYLGCLLKDSSLCTNSKYPMDKDDFTVQIHKVIWACINNLARNGCKNVTIVDLESFLKPYTVQLGIYNDNGGKEYLQTILKLSDVKNFEYYYEQTRLYSCLREYESSGYNISKFWDVNKKDDDNIAGLENVKVEDVINYFEGIQVSKKKKFNRCTNIEETKLGSWFKEIKDEFMEAPMYGGSWFSGYMNTATRGFIKGQLTVISMSSGSGKSTIGISEICKVSCDELWDYDKLEYTKNKSFTNSGSLMIQYEMNNKYECTPKFVSCISGVPCNHILNGKYIDDEEERVDYAIEILERSNIHIVMMPNFTTTLLETYVRDYKLNYGISYLVFDYISEQSSVNSDISKKNGVTTRIDNVLSTIASALKDLCVENDIGCLTFTQTNSNLNTMDYLNASCISGSMAIQNKADIAGVLVPLRPKEEAIWETLKPLSKYKLGELRCNRILHLYKVRFGSEEQGLKIWINLDLSNGHVTDLFVTNRDNIPYSMQASEL